MGGLTKIDNNRIEANLAESWEIDESGKEIIIKIKKVYWNDGEELIAQHFVDSWERLLNPKTAADYAYFLYDIKNAKEYNLGKISDFNLVGVKALDGKTLQIVLTGRKSYFLSVLSFMSTFPIRKDVINEHNEKWIEPENIVTLGNYYLTKWENHDFILLEPRNTYKPKIMLIMNNNPTSTLAMFENGKLDIVDGGGIPLLEIPYLKKSATLKTMSSFRNNYIGFNVNKPPFNDTMTRMIFARVIDKRIFTQILHTVRPTNSWPPNTIPPIHRDYYYLWYADFIQTGNSYLDSIGYENREAFPNVKLLYPESGNNRIIAEILQNIWYETLGIMVEIEGLEWKIYLSALDNDRPHMFRGGWIADYPHAHNFMNLFTCSSGNNETGWCNEKYDELIKLASENYNPEESKHLYRQADDILATEIPIIPLFYSDQIYLQSERIDNAGFTSMGIIDFNKITLKEPKD
jgi:oligopeptide transport system substrate-binding protein